MKAAPARRRGPDPLESLHRNSRSERAGSSTGETRDRILDVAESLFAEQGFAATSVREIATEVGLTPASLYNHFSGKAALYAAVLERGIQPLLSLMHQFGEQEPSAEAPGQVIEAIIAELARRPHLPRLIHHEVVTGGEHLAALVKDWIRPLVEQGMLEMEREGAPAWQRDDYPYVIAAWVHLIFGHFAMAPLLKGVLDVDPLSSEGLARQTAFLRKLAAVMAAVDAEAASKIQLGSPEASKE